MTRLCVAWCPVHQSDWDEFHVVSPRNAALYAFPGGFWSSPAREQRLALIGCEPSERVDDLPCRIDDADSIPPYAPPPHGAVAGVVRLAGLGVSARILGLRRLLEWLSDRPPRAAPRDVDEVLQRVKAWEGPRHTTACLPRAVARWWLLLGAGRPAALTLGIAAPAARMHAWVTLDGIHVGEDPDEVAGYLPAVRYESLATHAQP